MLKPDFKIPEKRAVSEVENRYQQILQNLPVAVYTCDAQGYITEYNNASAALWGRHPELGKELWCGSWKMYQADGSPITPGDCPMAMTVKMGHAIEGHEIIIERPDGVRRWIAPHPTPIYNTAGEITGAVNMLQDITDQKRFQEETAHLAAIVESSDDAIIGKSLNGIVTSWNHSAQRIFGYAANEMIGQSILKLIPEDRHNEEPVILDQLRRGLRVDHFETKRVTKDRRTLDISLTISPIKDIHNKVIGVSKIARDITPQRNADRLVRESEERFRMAIAATGVGTWEYVPATGFLDWSEECRLIYQLPEKMKPSFKLFVQLIHPDDSAMVQEAISHAMTPASGGNYDIAFRILRYTDRRERWIRSQGKVYFDAGGQPERFIGTVLDVTDDRLAKAELEQKVEERTKDLKEANHQLAVSNSELEQFAFVASHDLQEPLRKIQAFGDMLKAKITGDSGEEIIDLVGRMQSASVRMKSLIDSLLSFSRVTFRQEQRQLVNLSQLLMDVLADLETAIKEKDALISFSKLFPIKGEAMHLRQLFQNLIGNALKFTKEDERPIITIRAKLLKGAESGFAVPTDVMDKTFQLIEVIDNGIGFEQEYSNKIFQLFQRLHGRGVYPGNGLGLSIVQKVVTNHQGYIRAISSPGEGTTFQLLLPVEQPAGHGGAS